MNRVIFTQAGVLDGAEPLRAGMTVVVEGDRVASVSKEPVQPGAGDRVIDLGGKTLMPGMITAHGHIERGEPRNAPEGTRMAVAIKNCRSMLDGGFTGMVSAGSAFGLDQQLKSCIASGLVQGPRIRAGSIRINTTGFVNDLTNWWDPLADTPTDVYVDGPDAVLHAVRNEIRRGAEIIKLFPTGGRGFTVARGHGMTEEELRTAIDAAHSRGVMARAHCVWIEDIRRCLDAGVDLIDHGDEIDQACIEQMAEQGTYWVPSMALPARRGLNHPLVQREDWDNVAKMLPLARDAGVKVLAGDDYGVPDMPHSPSAHVSDLIVDVEEFGITPLDAIRWATRHGADLMGRAGELGTVAPGALADLVVVDGDPSASLRVLADADNVKAVLIDGKFVKDTLNP
jgi:imidazolonepropionase-like amidohydrolase